MKPSLIYEGSWINIYTATAQAHEFVDGLTRDQLRDFTTCAQTVDRSLQIKRPSPRIEKLAVARESLFELRVTPRGRKGPHVRLLYVAEGRHFFVVRGVCKHQRRLGKRDIELADREATRRRRDHGSR